MADGEKYNKKGKHLGAFDPITGNQIKGLLKLGEFNHEKIHKIYIKI
ncbi:colicin E3/pyocin S6 family cytotoxin [Neisseria zalophi]|nr:colicin E3/pyocin S6 family cytotoxin [Neisseria zalophi]